MKYEIIRTNTADTQFRDVLFYIADDSGDVDIALAYLDKLEHAIGLLAEHSYHLSDSYFLSFKIRAILNQL